MTVDRMQTLALAEVVQGRRASFPQRQEAVHAIVVLADALLYCCEQTIQIASTDRCARTHNHAWRCMMKSSCGCPGSSSGRLGGRGSTQLRGHEWLLPRWYCAGWPLRRQKRLIGMPRRRRAILSGRQWLVTCIVDECRRGGGWSRLVGRIGAVGTPRWCQTRAGGR